MIFEIKTTSLKRHVTARTPIILFLVVLITSIAFVSYAVTTVNLNKAEISGTVIRCMSGQI